MDIFIIRHHQHKHTYTHIYIYIDRTHTLKKYALLLDPLTVQKWTKKKVIRKYNNNNENIFRCSEIIKCDTIRIFAAQKRKHSYFAAVWLAYIPNIYRFNSIVWAWLSLFLKPISIWPSHLHSIVFVLVNIFAKINICIAKKKILGPFLMASGHRKKKTYFHMMVMHVYILIYQENSRKPNWIA